MQQVLHRKCIIGGSVFIPVLSAHHMLVDAAIVLVGPMAIAVEKVHSEPTTGLKPVLSMMVVQKQPVHAKVYDYFTK